eukprot:CAMPEP_0195508550 /NCGR_PEP_ID=MMETSP0794_2-20130614/1726_1 /TAXON_ID=515487 /ORGANISM="Stephanopyxis turris, Strain CCMP 815" /LENGTH=510 /DNA_ID=CAMNT_0040635541 /DNA_START=88 /DNA_END=1620 /DNA_ORIENTATION=+
MWKFSFSVLLFIGKASSQSPSSPPQLNWAHFRFTVVESSGWVDIVEDSKGDFEFSGYCVDIIRAVASRANFTYELFPPSGFGSFCNRSKDDVGKPKIPYSSDYRGQYLCGQSDVQDDVASNNYTTDFFHGMFYVTPHRYLQNRFTIPFLPPTIGGMQLFGTATRIHNLTDLIQQQRDNKQGPVCLVDNMAAADWIRTAFPDLKTALIGYGTNPTDIHLLFEDGTCDIMMLPYPKVTRIIMLLEQRGLCEPNNQRVGLIGAPLSFGFSQFAIGIRKTLRRDVDDTFNYWMNYHMTCSSTDENETCDSFAQYYPSVGGTGNECGYIAFPPEMGLSVAAIWGITAAMLLLFPLGLLTYYCHAQWKMHRRIRKRFVWQLSRNIQIGESPDDLPAEKLAQLIEHIGGNKGSIDEKDLRNWMADIHLPFLSEYELAALWKAVDKKGQGLVTGVEFIVFLRSCKREFKQVYLEVECMPKKEKLKFYCQRLSSIQLDGKDGVRRNEYNINRMAKRNVR